MAGLLGAEGLLGAAQPLLEVGVLLLRLRTWGSGLGVRGGRGRHGERVRTVHAPAAAVVAAVAMGEGESGSMDEPEVCCALMSCRVAEVVNILSHHCDGGYGECLWLVG